MAQCTNYLECEIPGLNDRAGQDRKPVYRIYCGDDFMLNTYIELPDGSPATPVNSNLCVVIRDKRFGNAVWEDGWGVNITQEDSYDPDLVEISIPAEETATWRRGSYLGAILVYDKESGRRRTVAEFSIIVEYAATSPHFDLGYATPHEVVDPGCVDFYDS